MYYIIKECSQNLKDMSNIDFTSRQRQNRKYIYIKPSYFYIGLRFLKRNHKPSTTLDNHCYPYFSSGYFWLFSRRLFSFVSNSSPPPVGHCLLHLNFK